VFLLPFPSLGTNSAFQASHGRDSLSQLWRERLLLVLLRQVQQLEQAQQ